MAFIHERPEWPSFSWDSEALSMILADVRHRQGRLLGRMEALGFDVRAEASLTTLTSDVVKTSAIEGESLDPAEVRSSIARRLGIDAGGLDRAPARGVRAKGLVIALRRVEPGQVATADNLETSLCPSGVMVSKLM